MERIRKYEPLWGEWKATGKIGEGSFGAVYEVERTLWGNTSHSAVKLISFNNVEMLKGVKVDETISAEELEGVKREAARKSVREAALMDKLQGRSNIVTIYDYAIYPNEKTTDILIRMELLTNLRDYIKTEEVSTDLVIKLGQDICRALESCEKEKIIHRDIKPDNIFINKDGDFKLGDFGLSRQMNKSATMSLRKSKGTPLYMPPEAFGWGSGVDNTSDIYSLGLVMYQLLNDGNIPFCKDMNDFEEVDKAIGRRVDEEEAIPVPDGCREELGAILQKACAYNREDRYQNAAEMRKELTGLKTKLDAERAAKVVEEEPEEKKEVQEEPLTSGKVVEEKRKGKKKYLLAGLLIVLLIPVIYFLKSTKTQESNSTNKVESESTQALEPSPIYNVGDTFTFGSYPQDTSSETDKQPIEWQVLKKEEGKILVISKYALDCRSYHETEGEVTWETSDIRNWMNGDFYEAAFTAEEQAKIETTYVKAEDNPDSGAEAGNDTEDRVFLLSISEADSLFSSEEERTCKPTEYAKIKGVDLDDAGNCLWWLRSPGGFASKASEVIWKGSVSFLGNDAIHNYDGIRPAMWINLESASTQAQE